MARFTSIQAAFNFGVLDPHIIERRDTKFVAGSLSAGSDIVMLPQGGFTDRGGTTDFGRVRRKLSTIALTAGMVTLPNGGTAADFLDETVTIETTGAADGSRFVLFELDLGAAETVHCLDVIGVGIETSGAVGALVAEYWDGAAWAAFAPALQLTRDQLTRRFATGAPGHEGIAAQKFRVAIDATTEAEGKVSFKGAALRGETAALSDGIVRDYSPQSGETYQIVYTDANADVFRDGEWQAAFALPHGESQLREMKLEARSDTIIAWHEDIQPRRIFRLGSASEWSCDKLVFDNIPLADYGEVYTNGVNAVQELRVLDVSSGATFTLIVEGLETDAITYTGDTATNVANITAGLENLSNVEPGLTVTFIGSGKYRVEFSGASNAGRPWRNMTATTSDVDGYISVSTVTLGKKAGEPIISDDRGWPRVGRFAQQRLIMAGLKGQPLTVVGSVTGAPYDLNVEIDEATAAFVYDLDASSSVVIHDVFVTSSLLFFGDRSVLFNKTKVLSAADVPEFGTSDAPGVDPKISPVSIGNGILYPQANADTLQFAAYSAVRENFLADNASILSASLINSMQDMARRRPAGIVDSEIAAIVMADGTITVQTTMQGENGPDFGYAPWTTDGKFRSICVDRDNQTWFLAERLDNGAADLRLERHDPDLLLDEAAELTFEEATATFTGLSRFNGRRVWVVADDRSYGPFDVAGGTVTIAKPTKAARVGTWVPPLAEDPPVDIEPETRRRAARLKRINRMEISIVDTTSLAIRVNDGDTISLPLFSAEEIVPGLGPHGQPKTGRIEAEGMHGFTRHGKCRITQTFPGHLTVRSVNKTVVA